MIAGNHATRAFFRSGTGLALAAYDTRRGQAEGREADKVLAFFPPSAAPATQSSIVGLAQALTMFAGTFNKECPLHSMEAQGHLWAMYHAEPDLWLLLVAAKALVGPHCLASGLGELLKGVHGLMVLLHGLLGSQLEQDPSGVRVRQRLQPLLQEVAASVLQPDRAGLWCLSCPLGLTGGVPLLPISSGAFTRLQSLVNTLLVARVYGGRPVLGVLAAWQTCVLWSSLSSADTAALHGLVVRALEPATRQGPQHKAPQPRRPLTGGSPQQQPQQPQQQGVSAPPVAALGPPSPSSGVPQAADSLCLASPACWHSRPDGLLLPAWPGVGASASSNSGGTAARAAAGGAGDQELPVVWLQSGCERARLAVWHNGPLLLLVLLDGSGGPGPAAGAASGSGAGAAVVPSLLALLSGPGGALSGQLAAELPAKNLWHVKGLRYLYQDKLAAAVRASPLRKVATLSQASLHLAADARRWTALEAAAAADPTAPPLGAGGAAAAPPAPTEQWESFAAGGADADVELVVKGANDCWAVGRRSAAGRQLTAVVEGDRDRGLLGTVRRVQAFCDAEVPGVFSGMK